MILSNKPIRKRLSCKTLISSQQPLSQHQIMLRLNKADINNREALKTNNI